MQNDPRGANRTFSQESVHAYLQEYSSSLGTCLKTLEASVLDRAAQAMRDARSKGLRIFVGGNGGSAAIAQHLECDWHKGVHLPGKKGLHIHTLTTNMALFSAVANDFGYDQTLSYQLEMADPKEGEIALLISSSGNSANIVEAARFAKKRNMTVIGLTGFKGGQLKDLSDISLHIPYENYGVVEDAHQVLMHVLAQHHDLKTRSQM
jgi:phosphoheptose isomerase